LHPALSGIRKLRISEKSCPDTAAFWTDLTASFLPRLSSISLYYYFNRGEILIEYISILGSTGSIGTQTLEVAESLGIKIVGLAALKNVSLMEEQARRFKPEYVALHDEEKAKELKLRLADTSVKVDGG